MRMIACIINALLLVASLSQGHAWAGTPHLLEVTTEPQPIYSASQGHCNVDFIPDSPARAFKRADGNIELIASHYENWRLLGKSFQSMRQQCESIMPSRAYAHEVRGLLWIQATYTVDGKIIEGIASQDLSRVMAKQGCTKSTPGQCWINKMTAIRSEDEGDHFSPRGDIASLGDTYPSGQTERIGFFTSSNIVQHDHYYYVMLFLTAPTRGAQKSGTCLFRTSDVTAKNSWRGWDGNSFSYDPLSKSGICEPVVPLTFGPVRSLQYVTKHQLWIAVGAGRTALSDGEGEVPGFYSLTSPDLTHWGNMERIIRLPVQPHIDSNEDAYSYPSLLDPQSKSRNFDTLDHDSAILLFTDAHLIKGNGTMNRDLDFLDIKIN